jgi:pilus assembly protein CpaB
MSARQIIVLAVAFVAAIGALLLIRGMGQSEEPAKVENVAGIRVLVALNDVPAGAALTSADIGWRAFPEEGVTEHFVSAEQYPDGQTEFVGAVTRRTFVNGEPIILGSVMQPNGRGQMAAQLLPGYRAISVEIDPESAAGGYIQPNDRVDVLLTTRSDTNSEGGRRVRTDVVLQDVRVMALGELTQPAVSAGDPPAPHFNKTAVLELTADDARALEMAEAMGSLSLALRGVEAETAGMHAPSARRGSAIDYDSNNVRIHAFGRMRSGGGG